MMPTLSIPFATAGLFGTLPTLGMAFPMGLELAALVPIGFAAGLAALLFEAIRATRRAERPSRPTAIAAHHTA